MPVSLNAVVLGSLGQTNILIKVPQMVVFDALLSFWAKFIELKAADCSANGRTLARALQLFVKATVVPVPEIRFDGGNVPLVLS